MRPSSLCWRKAGGRTSSGSDSTLRPRSDIALSCERRTSICSGSSEVEELRRKAATGRAQDEGVARQEILGEDLQNRFPSDHVEVIRRGQSGADVRHTVLSGASIPVGKILWEVKLTATWSNDWLAKLKADQQKDGAQIGVIASAALPRRTDPVSLTDGVWVCDLDHALPLAVALRAILVQIAGYEAANATRADVACRVFDYIATGGFTQHVSSMCDTVTAQRIDSTKIQKAMQQFLKAEETRLTSLENELASMVGELLGLGATICDSVRFDHVATSTGVTKPRAVLVRVPRTALRRVPAQRRVQPSA